MAYVISKQGNRNLVPEADDLEWFKNLDDANEAAAFKAMVGSRDWFVHEVTFKPVYFHKAVVTVESNPIA